MKILDLYPVAAQGNGGLRTIAEFDLELSETVRLFGLRLLETPDGRRIVYAAQAGSRRTATFDPRLAAQITTMASTIYGEATTANGTTSKA
ncbi:hypothetical protein [Rhizobium leucaenae]|uniref:hypothetical protein n=1 Tax=Rhizobium leucaenae TaxID=29450 RepID=UPI0016106288|nr:hypothetical protein [Rhizobium leucaenae]MBB6304030.1 hypothetical protein [Rhizobium leucaenae]